MSEAPKPGVYQDVPEPVYRAWDAANYSSLKVLAKSVDLFCFERDNPRQPSIEMKKGAALDCRRFSPEIFDTLYVCGERIDRRSKAGKEAAAKQEAAAGERTVFDPDDWNDVLSMAGAIARNPVADEMLSRGSAQVAIVWHDDETGILCKGRIDYLRQNAAIDLKTTSAIDTWPGEVIRFGYSLQAAFYMDGLKALGEERPEWLWVCVENCRPYRVRVRVADENLILCGRFLYRRALHTWKSCQKSGVWSDPQAIETVTLPAWFLRENGVEVNSDVGF